MKIGSTGKATVAEHVQEIELSAVVETNIRKVMGGKSYYCDYCNCFMKNDINVRKNHNIGMLHNVAKANYLAKYKDPQQIITEERTKTPCKRYLSNKECQFGSFCHFSHYSHDELAYLEWKSQNKDVSNEYNGSSLKLPWKYSQAKRNIQSITPSLEQIDFNKVTAESLSSQWG